MKILLVEDDPDILKNLSLLLAEEGFSVCAAASAGKAYELLKAEEIALVLLDITLPDGNGYSICTRIRNEYDIPVIFLTALGDESSTVTGFSLGADDYIAKPFRPMELISRVKNVLRRSGKSQSVLRVGNVTVDTNCARVTKNGWELNLSALEYRLLLIFLGHRGKILSRNRLLEEIWDVGGDFVNDNTLTVYMKRLREKIEDDPGHPVLIQTVRGMGYRME